LRGRWSSPKKLFAKNVFDQSKPSTLAVENRPAFMDKIDDLWVDELKRGIKACEVFVFYPLWWLCYNQINNNLTSQAATMNTHGIPNDVLNNLDPFALIILIPICDLFVYPAFRKMGWNFSPVKKIIAGFFTGTASMIAASVTQYYIYQTSPCGYQAASCDEPSPLNVWIQTPSYVLIALSEIFASITGLEYAYTKAPASMKTVVTALFLLTNAFAAAIGEAFNPLVADPLQIWNYALSGILSFIGGCAFWYLFRQLDRDERALNDMSDARVYAAEVNGGHSGGRHSGETYVPSAEEKKKDIEA